MQEINTRILTLCGLVISMALWLFSAPVQADIACDRGTSIFNVPSITFNVPSTGGMIGKPIGDWVEQTLPLVSGCTRPIYALLLQTTNLNTALTYTEGGVNYTVVKSAATGIGYVVAVSDSFTNITYPLSTSMFISPYIGTPRGTSANITIRFRYVVTANLGAGVVNVGTNLLGAVVYGVGGNTDPIWTGNISLGGSSIIITTNTCAVTTPIVNVPLADVNDSDLPNISDTAKEKDFHVLMNCQSGVNVFAQLSGTQDPDTSTDGVLQITNPGAATSATGVGIQILDGSRTPMKIGVNKAIKYSNGGDEDMTFYARYYRTRSTLTVGAANTVATLNINYQ
ncbi:fimbrial protein [Serratia fonticola]|uniref:fimbrial protein n=1 Tax=Serratia fonticola TaxID=47917 RepID=UPI003AAABDBB